MKIARILAITQRVFRGFLHDKRSIGLMVIAPLLAMTVFGIAFGGEVSNVNIIIVNEDVGATVPFGGQIKLSEEIIGNIDTDVLNIEMMDSMEDAVKKVENGDVWAAIHFPANLTESMITENLTTITISADMSNTQIYAAIITELNAAMEKTREDLGIVNHLEIALDAVYGEGAEFTDFLIPGVIAFAIFLLTTLLTLLTFTTERVNKTLDRILVTPVTEGEIVAGYALAFGLIGTGQAILLISWGIVGFDIFVEGSLLLAILIAALLAIASMAFGILLSSAAKTETQATQMIPMIVLPVFLLSGIFWPIEAIPAWLRPAAYLLPPTHAVDALRSIMIRGWGLAEVWPQVVALFVFIAGFLMLAAFTLRRKG